MKRLNYAIVFVSDMKHSVKFYRDVLGLPLKFTSPGWSEFANEGSPIALHLADSVNPAGASEGRNPAGTCQLAFHVENLDEVHRRLESKGVKCVMAPRTEEFGSSRLSRVESREAEPRGIRQAIYTDPDGLHFTIAESLKK